MISAERTSLLNVLQQRLTYTFTNPQWLDCALTHRSYAQELAMPHSDYERLEFLGDAVLGLIVGTYLYVRYPTYSEGQLSRLRSHVVNESSLAQLARQLDLGRFLLLGRGEERTGGRDKNSLLADAFEAVIGAMYLDSALPQTQATFLRLFAVAVEQCMASVQEEDCKGMLQEWALRIFDCTPTYTVIREEGPAHRRIFHVRLTLPQAYESVGVGRSKKAAEQQAAKKLLDLVQSCQAS